jgi:hypothetical protein
MKIEISKDLESDVSVKFDEEALKLNPDELAPFLEDAIEVLSAHLQSLFPTTDNGDFDFSDTIPLR